MTDRKPKNDKTQTHFALTQGTMVSCYCIVEKIGEGRMGEVWLAHDEKLNRKVALKFPSTEIYNGIESQEMLLSEAQAAAALCTPTTPIPSGSTDDMEIPSDLLINLSIMCLMPSHGPQQVGESSFWDRATRR